MIRSESCCLCSSFCQPSFHQQKPITAGHRFENNSLSAASAQRAALTRRLRRSDPNSAMMIGFSGASFVSRGYALRISILKVSIPSRAVGEFGIRAAEMDRLEEMVATFADMAKGAALQTGTSVTIEEEMRPYLPVRANARPARSTTNIPTDPPSA